MLKQLLLYHHQGCLSLSASPQPSARGAQLRHPLGASRERSMADRGEVQQPPAEERVSTRAHVLKMAPEPHSDQLWDSAPQCGGVEVGSGECKLRPRGGELDSENSREVGRGRARAPAPSASVAAGTRGSRRKCGDILPKPSSGG